MASTIQLNSKKRFCSSPYTGSLKKYAGLGCNLNLYLDPFGTYKCIGNFPMHFGARGMDLDLMS